MHCTHSTSQIYFFTPMPPPSSPSPTTVFNVPFLPPSLMPFRTESWNLEGDWERRFEIVTRVPPEEGRREVREVTREG